MSSETSAGAHVQVALRLGPSDPSSVSALISMACASASAGSPPPSAHSLGRAREVRRAVRRREAPQIVEADLRHRQRRQRLGGLRVEVAQQPIAQPVVGQRPQLLLDGLERTAQRGTARQRIVEIERVEIEVHLDYVHLDYVHLDRAAPGKGW